MRSRTLVLLVPMAALVGPIGNVASPARSAAAPPSAEPAVGDAGAGCGLESSLAEIPAPAESSSFQVAAADLAAATHIGGLDRPDDVGSGDDVVDWIGPLTGVPNDDRPVAPVYVPPADSLGFDRLNLIEEFNAELGWSLIDVDRYVEFAAPPLRFAVMDGDFGGALDAAGLHPDPGGVVTVGDGKELESDLGHRTAARPLGAPLFMALGGDGHLVTSATVAPVMSWLEGAGPTLADDEALAAAAGALDAAGCVSAFMVRGRFAPADAPRPIPPNAQAELDAQVRWKSFDTVGIGWSVDGDESVVVVSYVFADEQAAADSADGLEAVWTNGTSFVSNATFSEYVAVDSADASGRVVTVRLRPVDNVRARFPLDALLRRDVPFLAPEPTD